MILYILAIVSAGVTLVGAIVKGIWFKVPYRHSYVIMRNERVRLDKHGNPVVKEAGWRSQVPIRDDKRHIDCTQKTSILSAQSLQAGDGKNDVGLSIRYHVLSLRDGEKFRYHPVRTLEVDDLNQAVEELCRDAVRQVMATSKTSASQWKSTKLYKAVRKIVKEPLDEIGVGLDRVMVPSASRSEAQVHGDLLVQALRGKEPSVQRESNETETVPNLASVPTA